MIASVQLKKTNEVTINLEEQESIGRKIFAFVPVVLVAVLNKVLYNDYSKMVSKWFRL